ncbi:beta strand repeat-containing protein [Agromyces ramosus]|uniref:Repeat protein (TIGR01451 family) n=1 Tax=Agromyces ramosus TaxID=33879 RepID=A0ABU0R629_9MICO|nr:hypothetical protein [Agromyces ramosus]MDQ0893537.1 putative repeat protein (TIGR01451 family) [Agromyces ramosus]
MGRRITSGTGTSGWGIRGRRWLAPVATVALVFGVLPATPAFAAGPGVVSITETFVNTTTGVPITTVDPTDSSLGGRYRIDVGFACSVADCSNTTVTIAPNVKDPYYNQFILESAGYTFTPPFVGATSTGSPAAGITVNLGNLTAGQNGVFQLNYTFQNRPGLPAPGSPGSFFPNGFVIPSQATINSDTATGPATATASATWVSRTGTPTFAMSAPTSTRTDTPIVVNVGAYAACNYVSQYNLGTEVYQCAKSYTVTTQLPAEAQYVAGSANGAGVYDPATHTITWNGGDTTSATTNARGPLGRSFQVTYPSAGMPTTGAACVASTTFTSNLHLVLLDGTVQDPAAKTATVQAQNCDPFSGMTAPVKTSSLSAGNSSAPIVYIPAAGQPAFARSWIITAGNTANVAGVVTISDSDLDQPEMPVYGITNPSSVAFTVDYTLKDAANAVTTGTTTVAAGGSFTAPTGRRIVAATATSAPLIGPNVVSTDKSKNTPVTLWFNYAVSPGTTPGPRTNTATVTMSYPGYALAPLSAQASRTVTLQATPASPPTLQVTTNGPSVVGGGNIVTGSSVGWGVFGQVTNAPNNGSIIPQYVFTAPFGWNVTGTSWATPPPAGTTVEQRQVTIGGQLMSVVVATWPAPLSINATGNSGVLPQLYVSTTPTGAAPAGTNTATFLMGDAARGVAGYYPATYTETADLAGDGNTGDKYAARTVNVTVTGTPALSVLKEICKPDAQNNCTWIANSNVIVGVPPTASSIKYRITITNSGNAQANNIIAYDVLPYIGDTGTSDATAGTPRGSTVKEALSSMSGVPGDVTLAYSTSTSPPRPGVFSGATSGDWTAPASGASAIRATIASLAAGASRSFTYDASLVGGSADKIACNSVAGIATSLTAVEPAAVCATTQEADLSVTAGSRFPLQVGRVGTVPFVVNNGGGSQLATGTVTLAVPAGLTISSLTIAGWLCTAPSLTGPVTVTCDPVDANGLTRQLQLNTPETIPLTVTPDASVSGAQVCIDASIAGIMNDPITSNDSASVCSTVFDAASLLSVVKTDGVTVASPGQTLTYTITARNEIVDQAVSGVVVTDQLPANVEWVSGGTISGQDADGLGGTVTFAPVNLTAGGTSTATGDDGTSNAGNSATFTVTVRVANKATGDVLNNVTAAAVDPVTAAPLTASNSDTDRLQRLSVSKASNAPAAGVRTGDTVTYTVILTNDGTNDYTAGNPATVLDNLGGVLDDASYASGTVVVDGGSPTPISPNASNQLVWSGQLAAGATTTIVYSVTIGAGADKVVTNTAYASGAAGTSCINGEDQDGISCASVQSIFAPLIGKRIQSFTQNDDGTWAILYAIDVTNPSPIGTSTYNLSDTLRFGAGIQVLSATAATPAGVTAAIPAWSGNGAVATGVSIPGGAQHTYLLTVQANANQVAGTSAAACVAGAAGGFGNQATISLTGIPNATAQACATPVKPTIQKTVAAPTQQPDGSWNVTYTVTVRNSNAAPADLAYTVQDAIDFPVGTVVNSVQVSGPGTSATFDGAGDQALLEGVGRIPAPSGTQTSTTRVYTVTVNADAPVGAVAPADLLCGASGGGYANTATLFAGTGGTSLATVSACAPITVAPLPTITKSVVSSAVDENGDWTLVYRIDVQNPDPTFSTFYDLDDELGFASGVSVISASISDNPLTVTPNAGWNGAGTTLLAQDVPLTPGETHSYQLTVVADPGALDAESAAADCRIDGGETGTGFRNTATVLAGVKSAFDDACEPFTDPSVVKTTTGAPVQDPSTGIWTLSYDVTVSNRSTSTTGTIPYALEDELGFPADVQIVDVTATAPEGGAVNADFDGQADTELGSGAIGAAADESTPATQVYTVTVQFTVPAGITAGVQCDPAQGPGRPAQRGRGGRGCAHLRLGGLRRPATRATALAEQVGALPGAGGRRHVARALPDHRGEPLRHLGERIHAGRQFRPR